MTTMHDYDEDRQIRSAHHLVMSAIDALRYARKALHDLRFDGEASTRAAIGIMNRVEAHIARLLDGRARGDEVNTRYRYRHAEMLILEGDGENRYRLIDHYGDKEKVERLHEILDDEDIELMLLGIAAINGWDISGTPHSFQ